MRSRFPQRLTAHGVAFPLPSIPVVVASLVALGLTAALAPGAVAWRAAIAAF